MTPQEDIQYNISINEDKKGKLFVDTNNTCNYITVKQQLQTNLLHTKPDFSECTYRRYTDREFLCTTIIK